MHFIVNLLVSAGVLLLLVIGLSVISRYRMCPPDKILVVYGKIGGHNAALLFARA